MGSDTKIYAVAGNPVLHSKSPAMFNAAFNDVPMDAVYTRLAASTPEEIIRMAEEAGISGFNITSPFKETIIPFLDDVEEAVAEIGAANTVVVQKGKLTGFNTDHVGVANAFMHNGVSLAGRRAVILGAGGAAKAAVFGLMRERADVVLVNRTFEKAKGIAEAFGCKASPFENLSEELEGADILVSCIPAIDGHIFDPHALHNRLTVLDANYAGETRLVRDARNTGCRVIDGREWLLVQGTRAFVHLTGVDAPVRVMRQALYREDATKKRNVALIGLMGTGKTTIACALADKTQMAVRDIDTEIERRAGCSIAQIFEDSGEDTFRRMEKEEVKRIKSVCSTVVSCGGGVVLNKENISMLREHCVAVWLWADVDTVLERVGNNGKRPLLTGDGKRIRIKAMLKERLPYYASACDLVIRTDGKRPDEIAERIRHESHTCFEN